jgi:hypothetical protein
MITEEMIRAYLNGTGRSTYPNFKLEDVQGAGQYVMFGGRSECGHYREQHQIELLDIVAWAYGQASARDA